MSSSHPLPSGAPQVVYGTTATCFIGADFKTVATAANAAAPLLHRLADGGSYGGAFFALRGGRFFGRIFLFFGLVCSFLVHWPRAVDAACYGLGP